MSKHFEQRRARRNEILNKIAQTSDDALRFSKLIDEYVSQKSPLILLTLIDKYVIECKREYDEAVEELWTRGIGNDKADYYLMLVEARKSLIQNNIGYLLGRKQELQQQEGDWQTEGTIERLDEITNKLRKIINV